MLHLLRGQLYFFRHKLKKNKKFFFYNLVSVFIFALIYWLNDLLIVNNKEFASKYMDISITDEKKNNSLSYYLWFSIMTQTTVGYNWLLTAKGDSIAFQHFDFWTFKVLNLLQLFSIFFIPMILI